MSLSKSDFLLYLDSPLHLWAKKHHQLEKTVPSVFDQFVMLQGQKAEQVANQYLIELYLSESLGDGSLHGQPTFIDGEFEARGDKLIIDETTNQGDLYEIKSATKLKKENLYDATFQLLVAEATQPINKVYLVHLNADYIYDGHYEFEKMFVIEDITAQCRELCEEVRNLRQQALLDLNQTDPSTVAHCYHPATCPCLKLCHPNLPEHSIYSLPNLTQQKADALLADGIIAIKDIPADFSLSVVQQKHVKAVKEGKAQIDLAAVKKSLSKLVYPLYFLDYETCISALPLHPFYHPQQQMVFQYSLHIVTDDGSMTHRAYLADTFGDPAIELLKQLRKDIGDTGSVVVWNKTFESGRHTEMAQMYPEQSQFLLNLNERIYDLAEIFRKGEYVDQRFFGSWSIKKVLPVLVPELSYGDLEINRGDQAMVTWWKMISAGRSMPDGERKKITQALLKYCEMDTLAMVEIWSKLNQVIIS